MRITLIENAVDSLKIAIYAFGRWNQECEYSESTDRYLKVTIEFLHNTMELLLKALMIQRDEESIYCKGQEKIIEEAKIEAIKNHISLEEYLIGSDEIKTCSYNELLSTYFEMNTWHKSRAKKAMKKLGHYRNRIMHFGIDVDDDMVDMLSVIHNNFKIILEDSFYDDLLQLDDYFSYNDVIDMIEPWAETFEDELKFLAVTIPKRNLNDFLGKLENVISSEKFEKFIKCNNISMKDESDYEEAEIRYEFVCNSKRIGIFTFYDSFYNCTAVVQDTWSFPLSFCVLHSEGKMCIYNKRVEFEEDEIDKIYDEALKGKFQEKPLTENNIRNTLISILKNTILCATWNPEDY